MAAPTVSSVRSWASSHTTRDVAPRRRGRKWAVLAAILAIAGIGVSLAVATSVAQGDASESQQALVSTSADITSTFELAIEQEEDLVVSASGFIAGTPDASDFDFAAWMASVRAFQRYPELLSAAHAVVVPAASLPAFAARAERNPELLLPANGKFEVIPPGRRAYYCLGVAEASRTPQEKSPAAYDFCGAQQAITVQTRDSGQSLYIPVRTPRGTILSITTPVYSGIPPTTVTGRRAAFLGWVGMAVAPSIVLARALQGHPHTAAVFRYRSEPADIVFHSGTAAPGAHAVLTSLQNGWTVTTFGAVPSGAVFSSSRAVELLITLIALSVLLALLVFVLGTARERAMRLVVDRTSQLRHQALHDALTGLPNRALILDRAEQLLIQGRRDGTTGAAMFVDLDDFKNINDTLGHQAGDRLLIAVTARLRSTLREVDTIGRMGGDEFVVLINGASNENSPELVAQRLLDAMRQPFEIDGALMPLDINISIGIAVGQRTSADDLLRDADVALYQSKAGGKNRYEIFQPNMQTTISRRLDLEFDLRSAITGEQFRLMYQPIYNLDDLTVIGVEALLRWDHPTRGLVPPDEFIPILEQTGQIRDVGRWVLQTACTQMAAWHARGDTLDLSVNVSGRQLDDASIISDVREAIAISGLPATSLIIEITETALMNHAEQVAFTLQAIKELGVRIAVDDFGTGYSSLAYLRQFPVDCLKIDRMFTQAVTTSPESKALVRTLVQLGRDLGLTTLAEGVETTDEMDALRIADVNQAQGFLLARPLEPHALERQLLQPTRPKDVTVVNPAVTP